MKKSAGMSVFQRLVIAVVVTASLASLYFGLRAAWADAMSMQARWQTTQWQLGREAIPNPLEWAKTRAELLAAQRVTPDDPQLYENLGYLSGMRAADLRAIPELEQAMLDDAIKYFGAATSLRPMSPYPWANLMLARHLRKELSGSIWPEFDRAYLYGKKEAGVQRILAEVGFARWDEMGSERQGKLLAMVNGAYPHAKGSLVDIARKYRKDTLLGQ